MQEKVITIYVLCAEFLAAWGQSEDPQARMTTAEVMTVSLVAAAFFCGDHEKSRRFLQSHGYIPKERMLSKSRFNRRLHAVDAALWQALFALLARMHQAQAQAEELAESSTSTDFVVDSMPVPVCDNYRILRCRIYPLKESEKRPTGEGCRGRIASKRRFFYGLRIHLVVTLTGKPVECVLAPAATADVTVLGRMHLDLPEGASLFADAAYTDYVQEDLMREAGLTLVSARRKNSKRPHPGWLQFICEQSRKKVETAFSQIAEMLPRSIHAVTARGFELKVFLTVLAYSITA